MLAYVSCAVGIAGAHALFHPAHCFPSDSFLFLFTACRNKPTEIHVGDKVEPAGALIVSGKLREISVPTSTVDMNSFNKAFASFNTRAQFLRPRITGFVTS